MTYGLPAHGELNWDVKLGASIEAVKATADSAETPSGAQAKANAAQSAAEATAATALAAHTGNTSNPHAVTKAQVGLGNVDNTSDANKPVSTATQTALDAKQPLDSDLTTIAGLTATTDNVIQSVSGAWASRTPSQLKSTLALAKADVGLGNVDNTSDANKPVSTATQAALDLKANISSLPTEVLMIAVSDETTAITTGTAKVTFRMPFALTVTAVRSSLTTASSSGNPTVDINESGTSILGTNKLSIDSGEKTSTTAATPADLSDTSLADDAEITIDIDTAGTGAKGLKVYIIGTR